MDHMNEYGYVAHDVLLLIKYEPACLRACGVCVCMYVCMYVCMCVYACLCVSEYVCVCEYVSYIKCKRAFIYKPK